MPTKAIAKPDPKEIERAFKVILGDEELPSASDPEIVSRAIVERIMAAETFDETFRPQQLESWQQYLDTPVVVRTFHLNRTTFDASENAGAPVYAVCDLVLGDGEIVTVTCGGRNVLAQLVKMLQNGWLDNADYAVKMTAKRTAEGYNALWLVAA